MTTCFIRSTLRVSRIKQVVNRSFHICYGPDYISHVLATWAEKHGVTLQFIQPGNPQQNAYVERFNRTVRYDWLSQYIFETVEEVQEAATEWLWTYNNERPNMALGGITPMQKLAMSQIAA